MLGIYIHKKEDIKGNTTTKGSNNFGEIGKDSNGNAVYFHSSYSCYDWVDDDGYKKHGKMDRRSRKKSGEIKLTKKISPLNFPTQLKSVTLNLLKHIKKETLESYS